METFEQQKMSKIRPQVKNELKDWYDWLVNHAPETVKDKASRVFKTFKDKIMGGCISGFRVKKNLKKKSKNEESRAYRSYRINGRSRMDVDTFFDWIRQNLIDLMNREIQDLGSARVQTTLWTGFIMDYADGIIGREGLPFNSRMTEIFQGNDINETVNEMCAHMETQIENPALRCSGFRFDEVLLVDVSFDQLNLTRSSSYLPLPSWIAKKKAVINPNKIL